jgi:predicted KAP-like P-loop ATPase
MTTAKEIAGNPRLIKRFLNALSIRMAISNAQGVGVDEAVLVKMLLFERCAVSAAYEALATAINNDNEGKPRFLAEWEKRALTSDVLDLKQPWDHPFIREWLAVPPRLAEIDLRGVLYVSREHAPLITLEDRLSSEAAELLAAILEHPETAAAVHERLLRVPHPEMTIIMDRVLERARQIQEWGTPPILEAALAVTAADPAQGQRLAAFLRERPAALIKPSIVPKIGDQPWAQGVFDSWYGSAVASPVKAAITQERKRHGHV